MPACGKSRIGRHLAKKIHVRFVDLDKQIIAAEQKTITQIFAEKGENYFRELEKKHLLEISQTTENTVVSVGGGAPCFYDNMQAMLSCGTIFYLNTPVEILLQRIQKTGKRPIFTALSADEAKQKLHSLLLDREKFYLQAHHKIDTEKKSDETILTEIISFL